MSDKNISKLELEVLRNKQKAKKWRDANRDKINERVKCDLCNCIVIKRGLKRHQNTMKCKNLTNKSED